VKPILVFRHVAHESLGMLEGIFRDAGLVYNYVDLFDGAPRRFDPGQLAGLVVLGGPMNVDQTKRYPFLAPEIRWIEQAIEQELPLLGICLGSQLLAKALGARVYPHRVKEIGWYEIETTEAAQDDRLFAGSPRRQCVFQWHGDTFDLPAGSVPLASGDDCTNQAFRYGRSAYGLQFHLEVTAELIDDWFAEPGGRCEVAALDYIDPDEIRRRAQRELPRMHAESKRLFGAFAAFCQQRATGA